MDRRDFLQIAALTTLIAQGNLPLLATERKRKNKKRAAKKDVYTASSNIYTEPSAIEPITGYLPKHTPITAGKMSKTFTAKYSLITCSGSDGRRKEPSKGTSTPDTASETIAMAKARTSTRGTRILGDTVWVFGCRALPGSFTGVNSPNV